MLRQSLLTFSSKFFIAIVNFLTVVITARYLGAEGRGVISLFVLDITIVLMVSSFIGGPGLVYLFPRHDVTKLLSVSYLWAMVSSVLVSFVLLAMGLVPHAFFLHLMILSFLQSILRIQTSLLLSKQKISQYNWVSAVYPVSLFLFLFYAFEIKQQHYIEQYFTAFYLGLGLSIIYSSWLVYKSHSFSFSAKVGEQFEHAFKLGYIIQAANIIQLLNYRFSYFLLDHYYGKHEVGVYSTAISFAETVWIITNSFATVQSAKIVNSQNDDENTKLTIDIIQLVSVLTIAAIAVLLLLPQTFFTWMLGNDFATLTHLLPFLAPGIFFLLFSVQISHYYSSTGNPKMGLLGSFAGLIVTLIGGFLLIPEQASRGAAITASFSYIISSLLLLIIFKNEKKLNIKSFIPSFKNIMQATDKIKN